MKKIYYLLFEIIFLGSCSLDYSDAELLENLSENTPNTIIYNYESVEIKQGSPVLIIKADKAEMFNSIEETHLQKVDFSYFDNNEISNRGSSDNTILNMKSANAQLKGSIKIESIKEKSSLQAESLSWIDEEQLISSNIDDKVIVTDKKGSKIAGQGFSADLRRKSFFFKKKAEGQYQSNEN